MMVRVAIVSARARVHSGNKHEIGREGHATIGASDGDLMVFKRLAQGLQNSTGIFGELVEEKYTEMGERNFSGCDRRAAAEHRGIGGGVMRGAEWAGGDNIRIG